MNKLKTKVIVLIISAFLSIGTIGLIISMSQIDKQTEETTMYYSATIADVHISDVGKNVYVEICTKEYDTTLQISTNISKNISINDIRDLEKGQRIFFRIENIKYDQMNKVDFINIVSLKTETKDIFSLEEYNGYINNTAYPARIASVFLVLFFLFMSLFCLCSIKRKTNKQIT